MDANQPYSRKLYRIIMRMWDRAVYRRSLTFNIEDTTIYQSSSSECYLKTVLLYLHATGSSRTPRPPNGVLTEEHVDLVIQMVTWQVLCVNAFTHL